MKLLVFTTLILFTINIQAQNILTLDEAITAALKNNFSVTIAKNNLQIDANNVSPGNAGMLPQLNLNGNYSAAGVDTKQQYASGLEVNKSNASSSAFGYGVTLNWTLFDGTKMFVTYNKLKETEWLSDLELKLQTEEVIYSVITSYYSVVEKQQGLDVANEALKVAEERKKIAETKFSIGSASGVELNQAKIEFNNAKTTVLQLQNSLSDAKITLNQLLALPVENNFSVTDSIQINYNPVLDNLKKSVPKQNFSLLYRQQSVSLSALEIKELKTNRLPEINFNSGYNFNRASNNASFVLLNQNLGWNAGITASINLFSGLNLNRQIQNAKITLLNSNLQLQQTQLQVDAALLSAYNQFQSDLLSLSIQEESYAMAKSNLDISIKKYQLGSLSALELSYEQQTFREAGEQVVTARYNAKLSEAQLMKLNGELVK